MGVEAFSSLEEEPGEAEEAPEIPEAPAELPEAWSPPDWTPEAPFEQNPVEGVPSPEQPAEETIDESGSEGVPLGGGFEGLGGGDISIQPPPGATDDPAAATDDPDATTDNPAATKDDPGATDQAAGTGGGADDQSDVTAAASDAGERPPAKAPAANGDTPQPANDDGVRTAQDDAETEALVKELDALRRQQDEEFKKDLEDFANRPKPAYYQAPESEVAAEVPQSTKEIEPLDAETLASIQQQLKEQYPTIDYDNLKYEFGSPHEEYELAKDLAASQRRAEVANAANTADSLPDAIETTLKAANEAKGEVDKDTAAMDEWMRLKYGSAPYTIDAYPKQEVDPDSTTEAPDETETE